MRAATLRSRLCLVAICLCGAVASADDCTVPKPFQVTHEQILSGRLHDLMGGSLDGVQLTLLSDKRVVRYARTDPSGKFDFGKLPNGTYSLRFRHKDANYCAPEVACDESSCTLAGPVKRHPAPAGQ